MRKLFLLGTLAICLSSCYNTRILVGNVTSQDGMRKVGSTWNSHLIGGLIPLNSAKVAPRDMVAGYQDYMIKTNTSFLNLLVSGVTFGIYTPTQTSYYVPYQAQAQAVDNNKVAAPVSTPVPVANGSNQAAVVNTSVNYANSPAVQQNGASDGIAYQDNNGERDKYSKYFNIAYVSQKLNSLKSDYGVALTRGRTYYLFEPVPDILKIGLDWTMFDVNFAGYSMDYYDRHDSWTINMYQGELGMHVGPSVTVAPVKNFRINGYFRYAPSFTCFYDDEDFYCNYGSFFVSGFALSYRTISVGLEGRWGRTKFNYGEDGDTYKVKMKTTGTRFYLSFRF